MNAAQFAERRARVAAYTEMGWTAKQIGEHLGMSVRRVKYDRMVSGCAKPRVPVLSDAEKKRAKALLVGGASYYAAARAIGRHVKTIRQLFPGYGFDVAAAREAAGHRREAVSRMTRQGSTLAQIEAALGISRAMVIRDRRALGLTQKPAPLLTDTEMAEAKEMLEDGASYAEVARTLGRSDSVIRKKLPGYAWSKEQCAEAAHLGRVLANLERSANVVAAQDKKGKAA